MARSTRLERQVPHVVDGRERMVRETYTVPAPPRDWDQIVLNAVTVIAVIVLAASVAWTTASVGDLLGHAVLAAIAYGAASAFDLVWIGCMAVEWLARYEPAQARTPQVAGIVALLLSMTAVAVHGWWLLHSPAVGLIGAGVSLLAKGLWTVVLRHTARPLDDRTRQWFELELGELNVELGALPLKRRAARGRALLAAEQQALGVTLSDGVSDTPVTVVTTPVPPAVPAAPVAAVSSVNALPTPVPTAPSATPAQPPP
ncbi:hypothetical protein, partial [Peterkaempfera griseoplana]|uniref:hypothetical protein n=1 Tax=Peterkaempfera griseoplana TaxID=66896 RepID=UPI0006E18679